jgi:hypothetical protein
MEELIKKLQYAKDAVRYLLDHDMSNVDFHGIAYWASEVERLRIEVKKLL